MAEENPEIAALIGKHGFQTYPRGIETWSPRTIKRYSFVPDAPRETERLGEVRSKEARDL